MKSQISYIDEEFSMQSESEFSPEDSPSYQSITQKKEKVKKPKRNKSAFILFSSDMRPQLKSQTNSNSNEMMVKLAELWRGLPSDEKEEYNRKAKQDKERYNRELALYAEANPTKAIHNKTKNNHVKKPCSAYALFVKSIKESIKSENKGLKMADIFKIVSQKWKELSSSERAKFEQQSEIEKRIAKEKQEDLLGPKEFKPSSKKRASKKDTHPAPEDDGEQYKRKSQSRAAKTKAKTQINALCSQVSDSIENMKFIEQSELDKITEATTKSSTGSEDTPKIVSILDDQFEPQHLNFITFESNIFDGDMDFLNEGDDLNHQGSFSKMNEFEIDLMDFGFKREISQNMSFPWDL